MSRKNAHNALIIATLVLAAAQFARCYGTLTINYLNLAAYGQGLERMPFQGRMLLMYPMRWAEQSHFLIHLTNGREGALRSPGMALITLMAFVCTFLVGLLLRQFYGKASQRRNFEWIPAALFLMVCAVQYILHLQNVLFPYDMLSLLLFNLGLYLIYTDRSWWLVLLFPVITLNREVSLFLILLLALDRYAEEGWAGLVRARFLVQSAIMSIVWLAIHLYVDHRFANNPTDGAGHMRKNIINLFNPQFWPQLACIGAFLLPILWIYRTRILDHRIRAYLWIIFPWLVVMFFYGEMIETRVYGELSGLIALAAVLELEESVAPASSATVEVSR
jgi:hypothetical protein